MTQTEFEMLALIRQLEYEGQWVTAQSEDHQYIVRDRVGDERYEQLAGRIMEITADDEHCYHANWNNWTYKYYVPGDGYRYWLMTNVLSRSMILNRAPDPMTQKDEHEEVPF